MGMLYVVVISLNDFHSLSGCIQFIHPLQKSKHNSQPQPLTFDSLCQTSRNENLVGWATTSQPSVRWCFAIEFSAVMERRGFVDGMLLLLAMVSLLVGSSEGLPILADDSLQGKQPAAVTMGCPHPAVPLRCPSSAGTCARGLWRCVISNRGGR